VGVLRRQRQAGDLHWGYDQVYMIGHEAVTQNRKLIQCAAVAKEIQINPLVGIGFKNESTSVCALRNMVRNSNGNDSGQTSHGPKKISERRENVPSVPGFGDVAFVV